MGNKATGWENGSDYLRGILLSEKPKKQEAEIVIIKIKDFTSGEKSCIPAGVV